MADESNVRYGQMVDVTSIYNVTGTTPMVYNDENYGDMGTIFSSYITRGTVKSSVPP